MALEDYTGNTQIDDLLRVRLQGVATKRVVVFKVTPDVVENRVVNYKSMDPVHTPGQFYVYQNTPSRTINLSNVRIISRSAQEATVNLRMLNVLRAWTMPQFGLHGVQEVLIKNAVNQTGGSVNRLIEYSSDIAELPLGSPPEVLWLSAYSNRSKAGNLHKIPVVISQLSIPYPSDCDYIPTLQDNKNGIPAGIPMPTVMTLDINLLETRSPKSLTQFSLSDFRQGKLTAFGED